MAGSGPTDFGNLIITVGADVGPLRKGLTKGHRHFQNFVRAILKDAEIVRKSLKSGFNNFGNVEGPGKALNSLSKILKNINKASGGVGKINTVLSKLQNFSAEKAQSSLDNIKAAFQGLGTLLENFSNKTNNSVGKVGKLTSVFEKLNIELAKTTKFFNKMPNKLMDGGAKGLGKLPKKLMKGKGGKGGLASKILGIGDIENQFVSKLSKLRSIMGSSKLKKLFGEDIEKSGLLKRRGKIIENRIFGKMDQLKGLRKKLAQNMRILNDPEIKAAHKENLLAAQRVKAENKQITGTVEALEKQVLAELSGKENKLKALRNLFKAGKIDEPTFGKLSKGLKGAPASGSGVSSFARLFGSVKLLNKFGFIAALNLSKLGAIGTAALTALVFVLDAVLKSIKGIINIITKGLVNAFKLMVAVIKTAINVIVSVIRTGFNVILITIRSVMSASLSIVRTSFKAMAAATAVFTAALALVVKKTADFEKQIAQVFTLLPFTTKAGLAKFEKLAVDTLAKFPVEAKKVNEALFDIVSSGFVALGDASKVLAAATKVAIGGVTDIKNATQATITILKSYGKTADDSMRVVQDLFEVQRFGRLTFRELATNIGKVSATASLAGVSVKELGTSLAVSTLAGVNATQSVTALTRLFRAFIDPSTQAAQLMKRNGIEFEKMGKGGKKTLKPLGDILRSMKDLNNRQLIQIAGSVRAFRALAPLVKRTDEYERILGEVSKELDTLSVAFNRVINTVSSQFSLFTNQILGLTKKIGDLFSPVILNGLKTATELIKNLTDELFKQQGGQSSAEKFLASFISGAKKIVAVGAFITSFIVSTIRGFSILKETIIADFKSIADSIKKSVSDFFKSIDFKAIGTTVKNIGNILLSSMLTMLQKNAISLAKAAAGFYASVGVSIASGIMSGISNSATFNEIQDNMQRIGKINRSMALAVETIRSEDSTEAEKKGAKDEFSRMIKHRDFYEGQNKRLFKEFNDSIDEQSKGIVNIFGNIGNRFKNLAGDIDLSGITKGFLAALMVIGQLKIFKETEKTPGASDKTSPLMNPLTAIKNNTSQVADLVKQMLASAGNDSSMMVGWLEKIFNQGKPAEAAPPTINKQKTLLNTLSSAAPGLVDEIFKKFFPKRSALSKGGFEAAQAGAQAAIGKSLANAFTQLTGKEERTAFIKTILAAIKASPALKGKRNKTVRQPLVELYEEILRQFTGEARGSSVETQKIEALEKVKAANQDFTNTILGNGEITVRAMHNLASAIESTKEQGTKLNNKLRSIEQKTRVLSSQVQESIPRSDANEIDGSGRMYEVPSIWFDFGAPL